MYLCLYRVAKPIIPGYKISLMIRFQLSACLGHKTCQYNHSDIPSRCPKNGKWMATGIFGALPSFGLYVHHSASGSPRPSIKYICLWHQTLKWVLDTFFDSSALANCFFHNVNRWNHHCCCRSMTSLDLWEAKLWCQIFFNSWISSYVLFNNTSNLPGS